MKIAGFNVFPLDDSKQEIRLKRFFIGAAAHVMNIVFVTQCWVMGYFNLKTILIYFSLDIAFVVVVYIAIRSGINKRFDDPSLTFVQIAIPAVLGLFLMYFAGEARSTFLLLGVTMFAFGMFRFKVRDFIALAIFILFGYATLVACLYFYSSTAINLKFEFLQWLAFAVTLAQFSFLANFIGGLRNKVVVKNQELAQQNVELENALKKIGDMAIRDELTGVYNRRYLMERIVEENQRCNRYGSTYCLCMLDIDFFKRVNDTHGHLAGDEVLRGVSMVASMTLRGTDVFGRFGGEEFIIALINTSLDGAMIIADRVRQKIEDLTFDEIHQGLQVTVSIGVAAHVGNEDPAQTLKRADDALYRAKDTGRNRCVIAELT